MFAASCKAHAVFRSTATLVFSQPNNPVAQLQALAFETRRYAAMMGCSTEFTRYEGVTYSMARTYTGLEPFPHHQASSGALPARCASCSAAACLLFCTMSRET